MPFAALRARLRLPPALIAAAALCFLVGCGDLEERRAPPPPASPASPTPATTSGKPPPVAYWPPEVTRDEGPWTGRLSRHGDLGVLTVRGTARQRGEAHGKLLKAEVHALVKSVRAFLLPDEKAAKRQEDYRKRVAGAAIMAQHLEADVLEELNACAEAAEVDRDGLLLAQLFGDVNRAYGFAAYCTSFAAFGPATRDGALLVGRNFDYGAHGLEGGLPLILQEVPSGEGAGRPFVTIGYAGILNGWTAMNADGLCAANNTLFSGVDRVDGISTCFLLRRIVERCRTVEEGVGLIERGPRACTTGMLVAGRNQSGQWDARLVEFDAKQVAVVTPRDGVVLGSNTRQKLTVGATALSADPSCERYQTLKASLARLTGALCFEEAVRDKTRNPAAAEGVYMSINLHCALLDPAGQRLLLAVTTDQRPAAEHPFRAFRVSADSAQLLPDSTSR